MHKKLISGLLLIIGLACLAKAVTKSDGPPPCNPRVEHCPPPGIIIK